MKNLSNLELVAELKKCVRVEREATAEVLKHLLEVDKREAFLPKFPTLFVFCREELGYSEPETQLRIHAVKLLKQVPEAVEKLEQGELSMTVVSKIQSAVAREKLAPKETRELVEELTGASKREAEILLATKFPEEPKPEKRREISEDLVELRITVTREELVAIEALLDKRSHTNFKRSYKVLFMDLVQKENKLKKDAPPPSPGETNEAPRSRHIPTPTQRYIWERDKGCCQHVDPATGRKCGSKHGVQIDHIKPYSEGGTHGPENLRLLCGSHNRYRWRKGQAA